MEAHLDCPVDDAAWRQLDCLPALHGNIEPVGASRSGLDSDPFTRMVFERPCTEVCANADVRHQVFRELHPNGFARDGLAELRPSCGEPTHHDLVCDRRIFQCYEAQVATGTVRPNHVRPVMATEAAI